MQAAGVILAVLDVATVISVLVSLTGIGAAAGAIIISYRAAIMATAKAVGKQAAKAM